MSNSERHLLYLYYKEVTPGLHLVGSVVKSYLRCIGCKLCTCVLVLNLVRLKELLPVGIQNILKVGWMISAWLERCCVLWVLQVSDMGPAESFFTTGFVLNTSLENWHPCCSCEIRLSCQQRRFWCDWYQVLGVCVITNKYWVLKCPSDTCWIKKC